MRGARVIVVLASAGFLLGLTLVRGAPQASPAQGPAATKVQTTPEQKPQSRPHGQPVIVDQTLITVDDGDTVSIRWGESDVEIVRILGIDTPETRHDEHNIPVDQAFGPEARAFAQGAFAAATEI